VHKVAAALAALVTAVVAGLVAIPLVIGGDSPPTAAASVCATGDSDAILATIRDRESGGDYHEASHARAAGYPTGSGNPTGAYQFLYATWAGYGGYREAYLAPAAVQDARARHDVITILATFGTVDWVPIVWYIGAGGARDVRAGKIGLDDVPNPAYNTISIGGYQARWLDAYQRITSSGDPTTTTTADAANVTTLPTAPGVATTTTIDATSTCAAAAIVDGDALPLPRTILDANPERLAAPHHDYPAIDLPASVGTPVYAIHAGVVTHITSYHDNCYTDTATCGDLCGVGISITDPDGTTWIYCHASQLDLTVGAAITAGQQIMLSGNSGHSSGPHLHVGIRVGGVDHCPQPLLTALYKTGRAVPANELPASGCTYTAATSS